MDLNLNDIVTRTLSAAPQWIRAELLSKDPLLRARAEESLAAMIVAAIADAPEPVGGN